MSKRVRRKAEATRVELEEKNVADKKDAAEAAQLPAPTEEKSLSRPVRYAITALVVLVLAAAVAGIAFWTVNHDPSNVDPGLYIKGKKIEAPGVAVTIGSHEVGFDDYRHYYLVTKSAMESYYSPTMWDNDPDGDMALVLRDAVETEMVNQFAWLDIAKEKNIELSAEEKEEIDTTLAEQKETFGTGFEQQLKEMFFDSEEQYLRITEMQKLSQKAQTETRDALSKELAATVGRDADASYSKDYISAKHILIMFNSEETDTAKAESDALTKITGLLTQIRSSEDPAAKFDELMTEFSEDSGLETNPDGYTFKEGDMVEEFYQTALATDIGGISEPVKSQFGYHVIMRIPLSNDKKETNRETAISTAVGEKTEELLKAAKDAMPVAGGSYYDQIEPKGLV